MANTSSAKKATRKIARRTIVNKSRRTQMRGAVRTVEEAIKSGDRNAALEAMKRAEPELMQAAQRNIIHKNNASRKVSRLTHAIAALDRFLDGADRATHLGAARLVDDGAAGNLAGRLFGGRGIGHVLNYPSAVIARVVGLERAGRSNCVIDAGDVFQLVVFSRVF